MKNPIFRAPGQDRADASGSRDRCSTGEPRGHTSPVAGWEAAGKRKTRNEKAGALWSLRPSPASLMIAEALRAGRSPRVAIITAAAGLGRKRKAARGANAFRVAAGQ
jgi:hypothetical protein